MRKLLFTVICSASVLLFNSCSSQLKPLTAEQFFTTPTPMEVKGGQIPVVINGKIPAKWMHKKAVITMTPVLVSATGEGQQRGESVTFQGENVIDNHQVIFKQRGTNFSLNHAFDYTDAYRNSNLIMTFQAKVGKRSVNLPHLHLADGVMATSEFYKRILDEDGLCLSPDSFQRITNQRYEATVKFLVNQAELRKSELKNNSVQEFVALLKRINADREKLNLKNVEVQAYASPEGGFSFNDRLAGKRQDASKNYVEDVLKQNKVDAQVAARYTAQDWDGFQQLVRASNIQDKEVILRVLSMYDDPQQREEKMRNMGVAFRGLADEVLPELRRSRLIINYETIGRSDEQIRAQYLSDPQKLSVEELLYAATLTDERAEQKQIYQKITQVYPADARAWNNLGVLAFKEKNLAEAKKYVERALQVNGQLAEAHANKGLLTLVDGDLAGAEAELSKAAGGNRLDEATAILCLAQGKYAAAESLLADKPTKSALLACILNKHYAEAEKILETMKNADATTNYLAAVLYAREGNNPSAANCLQRAFAQDASLRAVAEKDIELKNVTK